jgi:glutathione S-transferase
MFAPTCTRINTYHLPVSARIQAYIDRVLAHPFMVEWRDEAMKEDFRFTRYPIPGKIKITAETRA